METNVPGDEGQAARDKHQACRPPPFGFPLQSRCRDKALGARSSSGTWSWRSREGVGEGGGEGRPTSGLKLRQVGRPSGTLGPTVENTPRMGGRGSGGVDPSVPGSEAAPEAAMLWRFWFCCGWVIPCPQTQGPRKPPAYMATVHRRPLGADHGDRGETGTHTVCSLGILPRSRLTTCAVLNRAAPLYSVPLTTVLRVSGQTP